MKATLRWGGGFFIQRDDVAVRVEVTERAERLKPATKHSKWTPKREHWQSDVTDEEEAFGYLHQGHEVEVLVRTSRSLDVNSTMEWMRGVVLAVSDTTPQRVAIALNADRGTIDVERGRGLLRRPEDTRELCDEQELHRMACFRTRNDAKGLFEYAKTLGPKPSGAHMLITLCRMGQVDLAQLLLDKYGIRPTSIAMRELAHAHARVGNITAALACAEGMVEPMAAQLMVEAMAIGITSIIQDERERLGLKFLAGAETNEKVLAVIRQVDEALPRLAPYAQAVRDQPPLVSRAGLAEAFNELLQSCGRGHAVPVSFKVLECMEAFAIPKDSFTYEAIGLNVVKRVVLLRKVWDLPNMPEEGAPEVVFAGRSNVGKSSLVNMLLSRIALAPTSQRPGKTKTLDFFDVNAGHPALPRFRLVDVPGLGFARASKELRQRWISLIGGYFIQRKSLKLVFHLLDAGLCEIMPADRELWKLLAQANRDDLELCIALTKADYSLPSQMERFANTVREALRQEGSDLAVNATIFACSAKSKLGKDTLWKRIWTAVGGATTGLGPRKLDLDETDYADMQAASGAPTYGADTDMDMDMDMEIIQVGRRTSVPREDEDDESDEEGDDMGAAPASWGKAPTPRRVVRQLKRQRA